MFNKVKSLSQLLVPAYTIRLLATGASLGDALVIIALSGIYAFYMYLEEKRELEVNKDIKDRLVQVETMVQQANTKVSAMQLRR